MEDMINRIIDMDQKAQDIRAGAEQEKRDAEVAIAQKAAALRDEYLERARRRITANAETERQNAEAHWAQREAYYKQLEQELEAQYAAGKEAWVDELTRRTLDRQETGRPT
ncbi:MAG: hypothetical protein FWF49_03270 [Oscillospiraceae bacterium]|nr:hypothetical protein [Oscillospiraceae bacterium]